MTQTFDAAMAAFAPVLPLAVGLSGGADSTALLLACARRWPGQVRAIHVHHGLQAAADGFEQHCVDLCARLAVPLAVQYIDARPQPGQSPEDAARQGRYAALEAALQAPAMAGAAAVALAQHADDQVETLLLALSRGAGVAGLASMPARWDRAGLPWHRPLLRVPGQAVRDWLQAQGQAWVEDPTNADPHYTRNRIRAQILPVLEAVFPAFRDTFARSADNAAQASALLDEVAQADLAVVGVPPQLAALQALPVPARPMCCATGCAARTAPRPAPRSWPSCSARCWPAPRGAIASTSRWALASSCARAPGSIGTIPRFWSLGTDPCRPDETSVVSAGNHGPVPAFPSARKTAARQNSVQPAPWQVFRHPRNPMALIVHKYGGTSMGSPSASATSPSAWPSGPAQATNWWSCPAP